MWISVCVAGCAHPRLSLPTDSGAPLPEIQTIHAGVTSACAGVRTLTSEIALSGRAGRARLRGRVVAGFTPAGSMRLEGVAPFGPPAFILVARAGTAVLLLPRESRVLRGARPEDVLGALTGVALEPADLMAILTGCVVPAPQPTGGRLHGNGWASIELRGGATLYLQKRGDAWRLRAATRAGWQIEYQYGSGTFPQSVRLRADAAAPMVDLTAALSQVETNADLDENAFTLTVPDAAEAITLDELRRNGPLGDR